MIQKIVLALLATSLATLGGLKADIMNIFPTHYGVTGIRQASGGNVLISGGTGSPSLNDGLPAFLYQGSLDAIPSTVGGTGLYTYTPVIGGSPIAGGSQFYGPNTPLFNSSIGVGNVRVVGAYKLTNSSPYQNGMMYQGPLNGSGTWTQITAPGNGIDTVGDTIPHSTMGDLAVGNFDYTATPTRGEGFIFDMSMNTYTTINFASVGHGAYSLTAYGIWQNGGDGSTKYSIVGGCSELVGVGDGYIVNYDSSTHAFSNFTLFSFNNTPGVLTHFEGISAVPGGFSLTSTTLQGAGYAFVPVNLDGSFGAASWVAIDNNIDPDAPTTGDTVIDRRVLGVYNGAAGVSSYISTPVPEPGAWGAIMGAGLLGLALLRRRQLNS